MFEIDKRSFGAFIAELRKEKNYTQKDLADLLFISDKAVSKWETGNSLPDTTLLFPLAELLGVSVTELLLCKHITQEDALGSVQVENIVKTAISYTEETPTRAYNTKSKWTVIYIVSILIGGIGLFLCHLQGLITQPTQTAVILGAVFGAYFCFYAQTKLPTYYDENRIGGVHDGFFRMNVPGLSFNNSNWPYIILVGRIWSCLSTAAYPLLSAIMFYFLKDIWQQYELYIYLPLLLGGLFVPIYIVGKKYQ